VIHELVKPDIKGGEIKLNAGEIKRYLVRDANAMRDVKSMIDTLGDASP